MDITYRRRGRRRTTSGSQGSSGTQDLECRTCGKVMLSVSRLKKHQLVHTGMSLRPVRATRLVLVIFTLKLFLSCCLLDGSCLMKWHSLAVSFMYTYTLIISPLFSHLVSPGPVRRRASFPLRQVSQVVQIDPRAERPPADPHQLPAVPVRTVPPDVRVSGSRPTVAGRVSAHVTQCQSIRRSLIWLSTCLHLFRVESLTYRYVTI